MAGRNDVAIAGALHAVAQAVQNQPNAGGNDEFRKNKPPEDVLKMSEVRKKLSFWS